VKTVPKKTKKASTRTDAPNSEEKEAPMQVRCALSSEILRSTTFPRSRKLLILNVHGTLLDCSLLIEHNPNPGIKPSSRTVGRRFSFRPSMVDFLCNCFQHFQVAFWGSKSTAYMQDVVPVMLGKLKWDKESVPSFVWSRQACEPFVWSTHDPDHTETGNVEDILWAKRLERVYKTWPFWNASNTLIVDHKMSHVV
jgi:hypothetical protein